jgi:hypothetical protein
MSIGLFYNDDHDFDGHQYDYNDHDNPARAVRVGYRL